MATDAQITIAIVTGLSTAIPSTLAALAALKKAKQAEAHTRPNGQGPLPEMAERQIMMLGEIKGTLKAVDQKLERHLDDAEAHYRRTTGANKG